MTQQLYFWAFIPENRKFMFTLKPVHECSQELYCKSENLEPVCMSFNGQWLYQLWNIYILEYLLACLLSCFSHVQLFVTLWTIACQVPLTIEFSRQEYWSGLPCPPPCDLSDPGIGPMSLSSLALAGGFFTTSPTWVAYP